jgi:hypothetical protein
MPAAAQAHSHEFVPGQSFEPGKSGFEPGRSGFEPGFTAGHAGQEMNLIVHAVVGGIPPFEPA